MTPRTATIPVTRVPLRLLGLALVLALVSVVAVGLVIAGGSYEVPALGLPDPGPVVVWGSPILRLLTDLAALATIGWLLAAAVLDPAGKNGVVSPAGRTDLVRAGIAACAWAVLALAQMVFTLANVLGLTLSEALNPQLIATYANEVPATRALIVVGVLAIVVAIGCFLSSSTGAAMGWLVLSLLAAALPSLGGHGAGLGDHAMAITSGVAHVLGAFLWMGGLFALALHAVRKDMPIQRAVQKFSSIALIAFVLVAASGLGNAYTRLDTVNQLFTTGYGQVIIFKLLLLVALGVIAWVMRQRVINSLTSSRVAVFARVAGLELFTMGVAVALGVALASSAPPRIEEQFLSYGESLLGFAYPPAPTFSSVTFGFRLDPLFFVGCLIAAALYIYGVSRLRSRGDKWPWGRTISWLLGLVVVVWCTNAGISEYAQVSVGLHMLQHMTLTMLAPILLVLGAPATLALRALRPSHGHERGPREWLVWFLHSWITRILTNPFYVFVVYVLGLYGLYVTPAFGWLMGSHTGHIVMQLHFLLSGYLFYWVVIGIDPRPRPLSYWARLLLLLLALAVHGFFAVVLMMSSIPLAEEWFGIVRPPWIPDLLQDSLNGGQVAWALAEIPTLIVMIVISIQWARSDDREAKRNDRQADRDGNLELNAYNDQLARLAERDRRQQ
ncbi:MAG: cytochrome c oxidase assembly protein [Actinomycetota bacterium]|nr:cytochrome c oxidase assembly protein [Actinomycetota bacterium]MDP2288577.1 cytochrome c oxidase assembly protein [Actinomycetota bacterium]